MRRSSYIMVRLLMAIPTVLLLVSTVFVVTHILPGDPVRMMVGDVATEEQIQAIRHDLGLDRPLYIQYLSYMYDLLHLDFGISINSRLPVIREISAAFPTTIELTLVGLMFGVAAGLPLGILAALKRGKIWVIFFRNLCNQGPPDLSLGIIVKPSPGFSSQVTSPDHFTQQGTWPIFGVPQFFVKIVLNHQEGV